MKTLLLLPLLLCLISNAYTQCPQADIELHTQLDVDNFEFSYPGCTHLTHGLIIKPVPVDDIQSLVPLSVIKKINGPLRIIEAIALPSLNGLENIDTIGGNLTILGLNKIKDCLPMKPRRIGGDIYLAGNIEMQNVKGLDSLLFIENTLSIEANPALKNLHGLDQVDSCAGELNIFYNDSLIDLTGLNNLRVGGLSIILSGNTTLNNLFALSNLKRVYGSFRIEASPITTLAGLEQLESVGSLGVGFTNITDLKSLENLKHAGGISLQGNAVMESTHGLENLNNPVYGLSLIDNPNLVDISNLEGITGLKRFFLVRNNAYTQLKGFNQTSDDLEFCEIKENQSLKKISGFQSIGLISDLSILNNQILDTISGFSTMKKSTELRLQNPNLRCITGFTAIEEVGYGALKSNWQLPDLTGFASLKRVNENIVIADNPLFTSLQGLGKLEDAKSIYVISNQNLINFKGLSDQGGLTVVDRMHIVNNPALDSLTGMESLYTIGTLKIKDNPSLKSLANLCDLNKVYDSLVIENNDALHSLFGLEDLEYKFNKVWRIVGNGSLGDCHINSFCQALQYTTMNGKFEVSQNAPGCQDTTAIAANCQSGPYPCLAFIHPPLHAQNVSLTPELIWEQQPDVSGYYLSVGLTPGGTQLLNNFYIADTNHYVIQNPLPPNTKIYIKIVASNYCHAPLDCITASAFTTLSTCPQGDLLFQTQAQLDSFKLAYPNCTDFPGSITVQASPTTAIENIHGLGNLRTVGGKLILDQNYSLANVEGLSNLETVGDEFRLFGNNALTSIAPLKNLTAVGGHVKLLGNNNLDSIEGLDSLQTIGGDFEIKFNPLVTTTAPLTQISFVGGDVVISQNDVLNNIEGFSKVGNLPGDLYILSNPALSSVAGFQNLQYIGDRLSVQGSQLSDCSGFGRLHSLSSLYFWNLPKLENLHFLDSLRTLKYLEIQNMPMLHSLSGLDSISANALLLVSIANCPSLSYCHVKSLCDYLQIPTANVVISGTTGECASKTAVLSACAQPVPECATLIIPQPGTGLVSVATGVEWQPQPFTAGYFIAAGTSPSLTDILQKQDVGNMEQFQFPQLLPFDADVFIQITPYNSSGVEAVGCAPMPFHTAAQCPSGDLELHTQSAVDSFKLQFPYCTVFPGNIVLESSPTSPIQQVLALDGLIGIGGNLEIKNNDALDASVGLQHLESIGGNLTLQTTGFIGGTPDFAGLQTVAGGVEMSNVSGIADFQSFKNLRTIGQHFRLLACNDLEHFSGLDSLKTVPGFFRVNGNERLLDFKGLESLEQVGEFCWITANSLLESVEGLNALQTIGSDFIVSGNIKLQNLASLAALHSIGGAFILTNSKVLENTIGLTQLAAIGGDLQITGNLSLRSLDLPALTEAGGALILKNNASLQELNSLENLTSIGGFLEIAENDSLSSLTGLDNILPGSIQNLRIASSPKLSYCAVESICQYLSDDAHPADIGGNETGCNSRVEIQDGCIISSIEPLPNVPRVWPSPFAHALWVESPTAGHWTLFDAAGREVAAMEVPAAGLFFAESLRHLPAGVYAWVWYAENGVRYGRVVK